MMLKVGTVDLMLMQEKAMIQLLHNEAITTGTEIFLVSLKKLKHR